MAALGTRACGAVAALALIALSVLSARDVSAGAHADAAQANAARRPLVLGYYVPYDSTSWDSLQANADQLDLVAAQWVTVNGCGGLASTDDQTLKDFAASRGISVVPSLLTSSAWLNHQLLTDEAARTNAIQQIVDYTLAEAYVGFDLDLEGVDAADRDALSAFVADTADALHAQQKLLTLAIPAKERDVTTGWAGPYDYAALGAAADLITIMAYEYRGPFSGPGSVAPVDWVQRVSAFASSQIPPDKVLLGLAFYGYDWNTTSGGTRSVGYPRAAVLADYYGADAQVDSAQQSLTFSYTAVAGEPTPPEATLRRPQHQVTARSAGTCDVAAPPTPTPAGRGGRRRWRAHPRNTRCGWKTAPVPRRGSPWSRGTGWAGSRRGGWDRKIPGCGRCSARGARRPASRRSPPPHRRQQRILDPARAAQPRSSGYSDRLDPARSPSSTLKAESPSVGPPSRWVAERRAAGS